MAGISLGIARKSEDESDRLRTPVADRIRVLFCCKHSQGCRVASLVYVVVTLETTMTTHSEAYKKAERQYKEIKENLKTSFREVKSPVFRHYVDRYFSDNVVNVFSCWLMRSSRNNTYFHAVLICFDDQSGNPIVRLYWTPAADDIIYGLRRMYTNGGNDPFLDQGQLLLDVANTNAMGLNGYVRRRFRNGTVKAKVRAFFTFIKQMVFG